jgi:hypothetical protein
MSELDRIINEAVVPLFGIVFAFGLPVCAFVYFRILAHRERMAMIQNGIAPGALPRGGQPTKPYREPVPAQVTLAKGIRLACIGFALTLGLSFLGIHDGYWQPGPWLLGGLIPLFIGIAQILVALISGATLGPNFSRPQNPGAYTPSFGPPPQAPPTSPSPGPASFDGPYTYRPGSTEQLHPPSSPPERL